MARAAFYACPENGGGKSMEIQAFGYLGLGASNLDDWTAFATSTIGMQSVDRGGSMRAFRMDDRKQRLFIDRAIEAGTQDPCFNFEFKAPFSHLGIGSGHA